MADHRQRHLAGDDPVRTLFVHAPRLIASCNVAHSRENDVTGPRLDLQYLASLGPQALPPVEASMNRIPALWSIVWQYRHTHENRRRRSENWRATDFRTWRLQRYLANNSGIAQQPLGDDKG